MTTPPTPRPTLRDEIYSLVMGAVEYRQDPDMATDAILALLRERLLSEAAVREVTDGVGDLAETEIHYDDYNSWVIVGLSDEDARKVLNAVLDTLTGHDGADREEQKGEV